MKLSEFLLHQTNVCELVLITDCGWPAASAYIDHEDLFIRALPTNLLEKEVKREHWEDKEFATYRKEAYTLCKVHIVEV